jgi:cobyrinic acid a,c-diamide synthase
MTAASVCAAILIAAPASGQGKTTVVSALARLHARQGRKVRVFKCGPDFLDPHWHALASGQPVYQLDLWMTGAEDCTARLAQAASEADLIIVEGVMGLFDSEPSAADLAERFGLHVLAVIDAGAMAGTFGALAWGLQHYRPAMPWAGVLANRVASEGHAAMLKTSVRAPSEWLGALMRDDSFALPERHLGLTVASEVGDAMVRLDAAADALAATPLGRMSPQDMAHWALRLPAESEPIARAAQLLQGRTIAVARDAAFCFIYQANLDCLQDLGAELVFFSPLKDSTLPACDAVWLPGGYPELHAKALGANHALRDSLAQHIAQNKPVWAECGGMMVLFETLTDADGQSHAQWALLLGTVRMQKRLAALGPQQLRTPAGLLRGHTFHYSTCQSTVAVRRRTARPGQEPKPDAGEALFQLGPVQASYFHAWFASNPLATAALFTGQE